MHHFVDLEFGRDQSLQWHARVSTGERDRRSLSVFCVSGASLVFAYSYLGEDARVLPSHQSLARRYGCCL